MFFSEHYWEKSALWSIKQSLIWRKNHWNFVALSQTLFPIIWSVVDRHKGDEMTPKAERERERQDESVKIEKARRGMVLPWWLLFYSALQMWIKPSQEAVVEFECLMPSFLELSTGTQNISNALEMYLLTYNFWWRQWLWWHHFHGLVHSIVRICYWDLRAANAAQ